MWKMWNTIAALLFVVFASSSAQDLSGILSFGDSYLDAGNNNYLPLALPGDRCNQPPYGRLFGPGQATGRFTDGELISDMIARQYGISFPYPLPYLNPNATGRNLLKGVNFASGGAGLLDSTSTTQGVASMKLQLSWFRNYIDKLTGLLGGCRARDFLLKGLYFMSVGSNDYAYKNINPEEVATDIATFRRKLIDNYKRYIKEIHSLGARKFVILNLLPLGCIPGIITSLGNPITRECVGSLNNLTVEFNSDLRLALQSLSQSLQGVEFFYVDAYAITIDIIHNPNTYGFTVTNKGCCGTGLTEFGLSCNSVVGACPDGSVYVYFDAAHGSSKTYKLIADEVKKLLKI